MKPAMGTRRDGESSTRTGMKRYWVPSSTRARCSEQDWPTGGFSHAGRGYRLIYGGVESVLANGGLNENFIRDYNIWLGGTRAECNRLRLPISSRRQAAAAMEEFAELL